MGKWLVLLILFSGCAASRNSLGPAGTSSAPIVASPQAAVACPISSVHTSSAHATDVGWHWWKCTSAIAPQIQFALFDDGTASYYDGAAWATLNPIQYGSPSCTTIFYRQDNGNEVLGIWNVVGSLTSLSGQLVNQAAASYTCVWN